MNREELKEAFPWLGTDEEVSGADVVETLNELYENTGDAPNVDRQQRFWLQHIASYAAQSDNSIALDILAGQLSAVSKIAYNRAVSLQCKHLAPELEKENDAIIDSLHPDVQF